MNPSILDRQPNDFLKRYIHIVILQLLFWAINHRCITIITFIIESTPWKSTPSKSCRSRIPDMTNCKKNKNQTLTGETKQNPNKLRTYWTKVKDEQKLLKRRKNWGFPPVKADGSPSDYRCGYFKNCFSYQLTLSFYIWFRFVLDLS